MSTSTVHNSVEILITHFGRMETPLNSWAPNLTGSCFLYQGERLIIYDRLFNLPDLPLSM